MKTARLQKRAILSRGSLEGKGTISSATSFGTYSWELVRVQAVPSEKCRGPNQVYIQDAR